MVMQDDSRPHPAYCLMVAYRKEKDAMDALALLAEAQSAGPCAICGSDEPFTGTCGSGDPRALCQQATTQAAPQQEPYWEGAEEWEKLAWHLCAEENGEDACSELIWEGGPIPEPWGDRWLKYEGEARRMIDLVRTHVPASQEAPAAQKDALTIIEALVGYIEQHTCTHEQTHRGGAIWEICDDCGKHWADDEGGKPAFEWAAVVVNARSYLDAARKQGGRV